MDHDRIRSRSGAYNHLAQVLGPEYAEVIMSSQPTQPATKSDIGNLGARLDGLEVRLEGLEARLDRVETRLDRLETRIDNLGTEMRVGFNEIHKGLREQQRTYTVLTIGTLTAQTAIFSVIVGLIT